MFQALSRIVIRPRPYITGLFLQARSIACTTPPTAWTLAIRVLRNLIIRQIHSLLTTYPISLG